MPPAQPAPEKTERAVTPQERQFLEEYVANDFNATQAYLKAWPHHSYSTARNEASKLLANPYIQTELDAVKEEYARRLRISPAKVLKELAIIAFSDIGEAFTPSACDGEPDKALPLSRMRPTTRRAIHTTKTKKRKIKDKNGGDTAEEIEEVEYRMYSKLEALDKLCKRLGLFKESEGSDKGVPLTPAEQLKLLAKMYEEAEQTKEGEK